MFWFTEFGNISVFLIPDGIPAFFDIWLVGARFLKDIYNKYLDLQQESGKNSNYTPLYIEEYYNVREVHCDDPMNLLAISRIVNALVEIINRKDAKLPKYLLVITDKDLVNDIIDKNPSLTGVQRATAMLTDWFVRQINNTVQRKKIDLLDKKPGAVSGSTKIIFVKMIHRVGSFHDGSVMHGICNLRSKFNDSLNDVVAKVDQFILTINSCNAYKDFTKTRGLSSRGS